MSNLVRLRIIIGALAIAALSALPASASASTGQIPGLTSQQCSQQKSDLGKRAFRKRYGAKHAMRNCLRRTTPQVASAVPTANSDCADELAQLGPTDFIDEYGDDASTPLADAVTECIAEDVDQILNPGDYVDDGTDDS